MQFCKLVYGDVPKIKPPVKYSFKTKKRFVGRQFPGLTLSKQKQFAIEHSSFKLQKVAIIKEKITTALRV